MRIERRDVLVVGGGPAGSTVAALLKMYAPERRVALLERAPGKRHHVGESLLPGMIPVLKELGVFEKIDRAGFPRKLGATYVWGADREPWENDFNDVNMQEMLARYGGVPEKIEYAWQVKRSEYDELLLSHAGEKGVELVRGVQAEHAIDEDGRIRGVVARDDAGARTRWEAEFTVDCSGQAAFLQRARPVRRPDPRLKNVSAYAYYRGAPWMFRYTGHPDKTKIFICSRPAGWFWYIPLGEDLVSVGLVTTVERLKEAGGDLRALFERELAACHEIAPLLAKAERVRDFDGQGRDFFTHSDWSHLPVESSGPGWLACGDAAVFVDPILSSGVTLAHLSGHRAAYTILEHWRRGSAERALLWADYGAYCRDIAGQYLALALFWYGNDAHAAKWWVQARRLQHALLPVELTDKGAFITVSAGLTQHYDRLLAARELAAEAVTEPREHPFYAMVMKGLESAPAEADDGRPLALAFPFRVEFAFLPEPGAGRLRAVKRARFLRGDPDDAVEGAFNPRKFVTRWHLSWLECIDGRRDWGEVGRAAAAQGVPEWWLDGPARAFARDLRVQGVLRDPASEEARA